MGPHWQSDSRARIVTRTWTETQAETQARARTVARTWTETQAETQAETRAETQAETEEERHKQRQKQRQKQRECRCTHHRRVDLEALEVAVNDGITDPVHRRNDGEGREDAEVGVGLKEKLEVVRLTRAHPHCTAAGMVITSTMKQLPCLA